MRSLNDSGPVVVYLIPYTAAEPMNAVCFPGELYAMYRTRPANPPRSCMRHRQRAGAELLASVTSGDPQARHSRPRS